MLVPDSSSTNPYENPAIARWLDSSEGVPEWPTPVESAAERAGRGSFRIYLNERFGGLGAILPGFVLALALAFGGKLLSDLLGQNLLKYEKSPISAILLAIVLGLVIRNIVGLPAVYEQGLRICIRLVLRFGIALLGLGLSLAAMIQIGKLGVPVVLVCMAAGIAFVTVISRVVGLPRRLGTLIAVGTSICGVSAIVATSPVIEAEEEETSYAVACVTLFGLIALLCYPFLAYRIFAQPQHVGVFLGTAIHDTSQVTGSALMYAEQYEAPEALNAAMVTKLFRNLCMAGVIPLMAVLYHRSRTDGATRGVQKWHQAVPLFVIAFVVLAAVSTIADLGGEKPFGLIERGTWINCQRHITDVSKWCLAIAMAAVGLGTSLSKLKGLGLKPMCVGFSAAVFVGLVSVALIKLLTGLTG